MRQRHAVDTRITADASLLDDVREAVDARLQAAVGARHLTLGEYERRLGILLSDQSTGAAIASVAADLPVLPPVTDEVSAQRLPRRRGFAAVVLGSALVGAARLGVAALSDDSPPREAIVVVPEGARQFDVGPHSGTVIVVVPDGVLALTVDVAAAGDLYCVDACAWPTGPP